MDEFKIDLYIKELGKSFPEYVNISKEDRKNILSDVLFDKKSNSNIFQSLSETLKYKYFSEEFIFDLGQVFRELNFLLNDELYVIWAEDHIDLFKTKDLIVVWESIWFPISDEAIILYSLKERKIVMITHHHGGVFYN